VIGGSLAVAVVATGLLIFALISRGQAITAKRVAVARQLGAEAVSEPRIDTAMLLAREAVNLNRDPQTEGTLLATLLRSPAALGTFALPINARPQSIALRPDGRSLAVVDNTGRIRFYDPQTHRAQAILTDSGETQAPTYSSDGSLLVYGAGRGSTKPFVAVRNAYTLRLLRRLQFDHRWLTVPGQDLLNATGGYLISPDDRTLYYPWWEIDAAGNPGAAYLDRWSLRTGRLLSTTPLGPGPVTAARLVATGRRLIIINARDAEVLNARSLERLRSHPITPAPGPGAAVDISPAGTSAVIGTPTGSVSFVNLRTGRSRRGVGGHSGPVTQAVYSPDGRVAVTTGQDQKVIVWDPATGQPLETLSGHAGPVHGVAFSADGKTLFTSSLDGVILDWDLGGKRRFGDPFTVGVGLPPNLQGSPTAPGTPPLAIAPDGSRFAARIGQSTVGLFSTRTLQKESSFTIPRAESVVTTLAWSPRGPDVAVGTSSGAVELWGVDGPPRLLHSLASLGSSHGSALHVVQAVAFASNGNLLAASDNEQTPTAPGPPTGRLAIWRTSTGELLRPLRELGQPGDAIAFSRNGRELAVGLDLGPVWILNPFTGRKLRTLVPISTRDQFATKALAFAPNGTLATGSYAGIVQLWNPTSGRALAHPVLVAAAPVSSIAFDPSGRRFATTDGSAGSAKLWFTSTLQQEGSDLQGDPGQWGNAVFSPDGRSLLVLYADGRGLRWPTAVGAWEQHACSVAGRNFTREEWSRFVSGYNYTRVCPR
jgi:WD40 repeat protein